MHKQLKLRLSAQSGWSELEREEWLPRFVRTLEAGQRRAARWRLRWLEQGQRGWEARCDRYDRTQRLTLCAPGAAEPATEEWTLTVESGPREREAGRRGQWLVGAALALAGYFAARPMVGNLPSLMVALLLFWFCVAVVPRLLWRAAPAELDAVDEELLERVRRGAAAFTGFQLLTREWQEPELP